MSTPLPRWPPDWLEDHSVATEEVLAPTDEIEFVSALRSDGQLLFALAWPEGRRWMLVDPVAGGVPRALRAGKRAEDPDVARAVEGVWSGALALAKQILDGELDLRPGDLTRGLEALQQAAGGAVRPRDTDEKRRAPSSVLPCTRCNTTTDNRWPSARPAW